MKNEMEKKREITLGIPTLFSMFSFAFLDLVERCI